MFIIARKHVTPRRMLYRARIVLESCSNRNCNRPISKHVGPPYTRAKIYAGRVACCRWCVSAAGALTDAKRLGGYRPTGQTDGHGTVLIRSLRTIRGQRNRWRVKYTRCTGWHEERQVATAHWQQDDIATRPGCTGISVHTSQQRCTPVNVHAARLDWLIDWFVVLRPTRHKIGHFGDVSQSQFLSLVWKK